jgi:hypothetical protein
MRLAPFKRIIFIGCSFAAGFFAVARLRGAAALERFADARVFAMAGSILRLGEAPPPRNAMGTVSHHIAAGRASSARDGASVGERRLRPMYKEAALSRRLSHECFDRQPEPTNHGQNAIDFHTSARASSPDRRLTHSDLRRDTAPRQASGDSLPVHRFVQCRCIKTTHRLNLPQR